MDNTTAHRSDLSTAAVLRLALAYAVAINGMILTPFIVSAVTTRFGLTDSAATQIAGIEIFGIAVSCALFPRWIARGAHTFSRLGLIGAVLAQAASALAPNVEVLSIARGLAGLFEGMLFVVVAASVAHRASTDRLWGQINLAAGILDGAILVGISFLPEAVLSRWIFLLLAGLMVAAVLALRHIGEFALHQRPAHATGSGAKAPLKLVLAVWIVIVLLYGIQASQWAVAGIVGARVGLSGSMIGILLSLSSLLGFIGAVVPSQSASRPHRLSIIWTSQLVMVASLVAFFSSAGPLWYLVSQVVINASLFVVIPFLTGMLSEVDTDGSLVSRSVVITFLGAGGGTVLAGSAFSELGGMKFAYAMCAAVMAAAPFVWLALRSATAHETGEACRPRPHELDTPVAPR
ncbi:MFS transporter [Variovorax sp. AFSI2.2]|uniref:MFS transporter n=1 Tax=Variovorax sp. AFSI2.2 TaxID=3384160 RepID=UPI003EBF7865